MLTKLEMNKDRILQPVWAAAGAQALSLVWHPIWGQIEIQVLEQVYGLLQNALFESAVLDAN